MDNKKKILLLVAGIVAVALICVVLVGLLNGVWPWQNNSDHGEDYQGLSASDQTEDTGTVEDTAKDPTGTSDATAGSDAAQTAEPEPSNAGTGGEAGSNTGSGEDMTDSGSSGNTGSTGEDETDNGPTIGVDAGDSSTEPSVDDSNVIDFDDLLNAGKS